MKHSVFFIALFLSFSSCKKVSLEDDFQKFTGRWSLHIVEIKKDSLSKWQPREDHYKNRKGFIIYDGLGGMGVHHVTENYESYIFEGRRNLDSLTKRDLRHLANNFVYFGKYVVDEKNETVEHHIESGIYPAQWNTIAKRSYQFTGDTLILTPIRGSETKTRLKWVRLNDQIPDNN